MRHRIITVPKNKKATKALDYDKARKEQLIELSIDEKDFQFLHQQGFIELINKTVEINIDDFEDDFIDGIENLSKIIQILSEKEFSGTDCQYKLIQNILKLFKEAVARDTGVYFFF